MSERAGAVVLVFARAPVPGQAKTRLIQALGEDGAAYLHAGLLAQTLVTADQLGIDVQLWCSPDTSHPLFRYLAKNHDVSLHLQCGGDLGQRMATALQQALLSYNRAVLIGTDCPDLTAGHLSYALAQLDERDGWVLGPAEDGGYYMIGTAVPDDNVFTGIDWGTDRVLEQTQSRFIASGHACSEVERLRDVDRPEDLLWFAAYPSVIERGKDIVELAG